MIQRTLLAACATTLVPLISTKAAEVTDWRTYRGTAATTLTGQGTNDPIIGDLVGSPAQASFAIGYLGEPVVLGANVGDKVEFTFGVRFNDVEGMGNQGDNFRFALFDLNGETPDLATGGAGDGPNYATAGTGNTDDFRGYIFGHRGGGGSGAQGSMRERIATLASGQNAFAATSPNNVTAPTLASVTGDSFPIVGDVNGDGAGPNYTGVMTLTRTELGVDVSGTFSDGTETNIYMASDNATPTSSTFGAVGFLIGGPLNVDQAIFSDVNVSIVPAGGGQDADFDEDADVDGADFLIWQRGFGMANATNADGNADGDSDVDADDLAIWSAKFGLPAQVAAGAAIPEPTSLSLIVAAGAIVLARRR